MRVKHIKERMKKLKITQRRLAYESGISQQTISNWFNFKTAPHYSTRKIIEQTIERLEGGE